MLGKAGTRVSDLRGVNRLTIAGIAGVVEVIEAMHYNIANVPGMRGPSGQSRTTGVTRLVYRAVNGVIGVVGHGLDTLLARLAPALGESSTWPGREALLAALNGVLGDYLVASNNPLAIPMRLRRGGIALPAAGESLANAIPQARGRLVVLLHGLCMSDLQWRRKGHDHGAALASGISASRPSTCTTTAASTSRLNGRAFADALESLVHRLAGAADRTRARRTQHGRSRRSQRLPLRNAGRASMAAARRQARVPGHAPSRRTARARRQLGRRAAGLEPPTPLPWRAWARFAAPASPTCASATWWTRTGTSAIVSRPASIAARPFRCRKGSRAMRLPPPPARLRATSATGWSAMASCRWPARWAATRIRALRSRFRSPASGWPMGPATSTCSVDRKSTQRSRTGWPRRDEVVPRLGALCGSEQRGRPPPSPEQRDRWLDPRH